MPADAAAERTTSESKSTAGAETPAASEPSGDTGAADSGDTDATVQAEKPDPDATVKVDNPDPDATAKIEKAAAAESSGSGDKAEPAAGDETVVLGKAVEASTVAAGKSAADDTAEPGADETVELGKSASDDPASEETVKLNKPGATSGAGAEKSESGTEAGKSSRLGSRFPIPVVAGAAVLLIAALVAVGVFFFLAGDRQDELDRRAAATKAACDFGTSFATYTGDKADDYVTRLDQTATGEWKKLVSQIGPDLKARFAETQVNSTAADVQCGYESGSDDKARVVLVIDQQFTTVGGPQQQAPGRVKVAANVDMERVDGTWLVANFDTPMMQQ
ncbi:hypothetical protein [Nocardia sp. NPDC051750]|uniref:hypothetical protein n=1 Tax=Nocardia sp. NPDC051750 TaxID=3364325 RepID=UPI0037B61FC4